MESRFFISGLLCHMSERYFHPDILQVGCCVVGAVYWTAMDMFVWFFLFGTIIGSFLNVVIYRLNTGRSLNGHSHCLSCGMRLTWYELVPVVSYVYLLGRCRSCGARITSRYLAVELLTGVLFFLSAQAFYPEWVTLILALAISAVLTVIVVYDVRHTIIPDTLVLYLSILTLGFLLWDPLTQGIAFPSLTTLLGGLIPSAFLGTLWLVSRGRWIGFGDVKLAVPLGFLVGFPESISLLVLAFWIGAVVSVSLLLLQWLFRHSSGARRNGGQRFLLFFVNPLTIQSEVPFAPFLVCAFFLAWL